MPLSALVENVQRTYTAMAYVLVLFCGILTVMGERFLYARRGYRREAAITAAIGWTYIIGGTLLFLVLLILSQYL